MNQDSVLHYSIIEKISEGQMGHLYKAQDHKEGRLVALRFLPPHIAKNEHRRALFIRETRFITALNHPNIATTYAVEEMGDELFMVTEFVEGRDLSQIIEAGSIDEKAIIDIVTQAAQGLLAAYHWQITHRGLKSSNIMIKQDGLVKILNFGLTILTMRTDQTASAAIPDSLAYMSPEQLRGQDIDERSDLWSLGVILYEMVAGYRPFPDDNFFSLIKAITMKDSRQLTSRNPEVSERLVEIIDRCLEEDTASRYQSAQEILDDLSRLDDSKSEPAD